MHRETSRWAALAGPVAAVLAALVVAAAGAALAATEVPEERAEERIYCDCGCVDELVAVCECERAGEMRGEIASMRSGGMSDGQIVARYERVSELSGGSAATPPRQPTLPDSWRPATAAPAKAGEEVPVWLIGLLAFAAAAGGVWAWARIGR